MAAVGPRRQALPPAPVQHARLIKLFRPWLTEVAAVSHPGAPERTATLQGDYPATPRFMAEDWCATGC